MSSSKKSSLSLALRDGATALVLGTFVAGCFVGEEPEPGSEQNSNQTGGDPSTPTGNNDDDTTTPATGGTRTIQSIVSGELLPLAAGTAGGGRIQMIRKLDGNVTLEGQLNGLPANTAVVGHAHRGKCAENSGMGHFIISGTYTPAGQTPPPAVEADELWLQGTTDASGTLYATITKMVPEGSAEALSFVLHAGANGAKSHCADLKASGPVGPLFTGTMKAFPDAPAAYQGVTGGCNMTMTDGALDFSCNLSNVNVPAGETCTMHLHETPCGRNKGAGHVARAYPLTPPASATNEFWPTVTLAAGGKATASLTTDVGRLDIQSAVMHCGPAGTPPPKVACAALTTDAWPELKTTGVAELLPAAAANGFGNFAANAEMIRHLDGTTTAKVCVSGAPAGPLTLHLHAADPATNSCAGHYLINKALPATPVVKVNEVWVEMTVAADGTGCGEVTTNHTVAADGRCFVPHGGTATPKPKMATIYLK
jgi:hypothetical protein